MSKLKPKRVILNEELDYYYDEYKIPKKSGKFRKIIAPSSKLKKHSRHAMHKLNWYFENQAKRFNLQDVFHGFVPQRNSRTACEHHIGYDATIMYDIKDFFDNVKISHFDELVFEALDLNPKYLFHKDKYAAQGFPSSPTLANIAIIPCIRQLQKGLEVLTGNDYALTIYADDIQISIDNPTKDIKREIDELVANTLSDYGFTINPNKTRIKLAKYGWRRILGLNVGEDSIRATRKTMSKIRAVRHKISMKEPRDSGNYGQVLGGLTTWSKCLPPKSLRLANEH